MEQHTKEDSGERRKVVLVREQRAIKESGDQRADMI
jgi:hypothetical protein